MDQHDGNREWGLLLRALVLALQVALVLAVLVSHATVHDGAACSGVVASSNSSQHHT